MITSIYILRLEGGHYYVGKSDNVMKRYEEHLNGSGSAWTTRHPPVSLIKTIENASPFDEDKTVKEYMATYGIDKVRGGSYVTEVLTDAQRSVLQQEIWSSQNGCMRCGSAGHWIATCHVRLPSISMPPPVRMPPVVRMAPPVRIPTVVRMAPSAGRFQAFSGPGHRLGGPVGRCFRCGRAGHHVGSCYASTDTRGYELDDDDEEEEDDDEDDDD